MNSVFASCESAFVVQIAFTVTDDTSAHGNRAACYTSNTVEHLSLRSAHASVSLFQHLPLLLALHHLL